MFWMHAALFMPHELPVCMGTYGWLGLLTSSAIFHWLPQATCPVYVGLGVLHMGV